MVILSSSSCKKMMTRHNLDEDSKDGADDLDKIQLDEVALGGGSNTAEDDRNLDMKRIHFLRMIMCINQLKLEI